MSAIIYARRSSESGDDYSLDTQAAAARQYAVAHGLGECEVVLENFTGTKHLRDRAAGAGVWSSIQSGQVNNLICYSLDRLSRSPLRHALTLIDEILESGVHLHIVDTGEVTSSDAIDVVIKSWQSAQERAKIVDRMMRGKYGKAKAGRWVGSGPVPFGFRRVGRMSEARLEHNPDEIEVVLLLVDRYLGLSGEPLSMLGLREELYRRGIRSPNGYQVWDTSTISRVLGNPALIGRFDYGSYPIDLPELAIIDRPLWLAIQDRMRINREKSVRNRHADYLLSGRLKCKCGRSMTAISHHQQGRHYSYYVCTSQQQHRSERVCPIYRLVSSTLDEAVWRWVLEHISDERLRDGLEKLRRYERERDSDPQRLAAIDAESKRLKSKIATLMAEFGESDKRPVVEARELAINQAADRLLELETERAELSSALELAELRLASRRTMTVRLRELRDKLINATDTQRSQVLEAIGLHVKLIEKTPCLKILIESEIAPPDELTIG